MNNYLDIEPLLWQVYLAEARIENIAFYHRWFKTKYWKAALDEIHTAYRIISSLYEHGNVTSDDRNKLLRELKLLEKYL
mgnify:CR=1 FL=1